ncbi:MAG: alpha-E domain-containing protein [Halothiobacillaceae bacterium]|nr:alpha-E domain-containing protein [Halothiobacillaceae bacterium]
MLSRIAENLYWMGRSLERAENTARLIQATTQMTMDLPPGVVLRWSSLLSVLGIEHLAPGLIEDTEETAPLTAEVIHLLSVEPRNTGAILPSLRQARENARTFREMLPRDVWEAINELYLYTRTRLVPHMSARELDLTLREIVQRRLMIAGYLNETMAHDVAFQFIRLGSVLERADMTTRIIDLTTQTHVARPSTADLGIEAVWLQVLRALSAYQMYRRHVAVQVQPTSVLQYISQDAHFPRSLRHAVHEMESALGELPDNGWPLRRLREFARLLDRREPLAPVSLHAHLDELQLGLSRVHDALRERYFHPAVVTASSETACLSCDA